MLNIIKSKLTLTKKFVLLSSFFVVGFGFTNLTAQDHKVAHTNVEMIMAYMPETGTIENVLKVFQKKHEESLTVKQKYFQQEYQAFLENEQSNNWESEAARNSVLEKLNKLDQEVQSDIQNVERAIAQKKNELLTPLMEKLQKAIDEVAVEKGYDYVLNQTSGLNILVGKPSHDITVEIAQKLGIKIGN